MPSIVEKFRNPQVSTTSLVLSFLALDITKNNPSVIIDNNSPVFSFNIQWSGTPTDSVFSITLQWDIKGTCFDKIPIYKLKFSENASGSSNNGYGILSDDQYITVSTSISNDDTTFRLIFTYDKSAPTTTTLPDDFVQPKLTCNASVPAATVYTNA